MERLFLGSEGLEGKGGNKAGGCWLLSSHPTLGSIPSGQAIAGSRARLWWPIPLPSLPAGGRGTEHKSGAERALEESTCPQAEVWEGVI